MTTLNGCHGDVWQHIKFAVVCFHDMNGLLFLAPPCIFSVCGHTRRTARLDGGIVWWFFDQLYYPKTYIELPLIKKYFVTPTLAKGHEHFWMHCYGHHLVYCENCMEYKWYRVTIWDYYNTVHIHDIVWLFGITTTQFIYMISCDYLGLLQHSSYTWYRVTIWDYYNTVHIHDIVWLFGITTTQFIYMISCDYLGLLQHSSYTWYRVTIWDDYYTGHIWKWEHP